MALRGTPFGIMRKTDLNEYDRLCKLIKAVQGKRGLSRRSFWRNSSRTKRFCKFPDIRGVGIQKTRPVGFTSMPYLWALCHGAEKAQVTTTRGRMP